MTLFKGSIKDFHDFVGPRLRNKIPPLTRALKKLTNGKCEGKDCDYVGELDSAHVHSNSRKIIIEKVLKNHTDENGIVECNLKLIEKEFIDAHYPLEETFLFLCKKCHTKYDNQDKIKFVKSEIKRTQPKIKTKISSKLNRIEKWAKSPQQINHKIISVYLELEKNGDVYKEVLEKACKKFGIEKFNQNFSNMKTDSGNSHGYIFDETDGRVYIQPEAKILIKKVWPL